MSQPEDQDDSVITYRFTLDDGRSLFFSVDRSRDGSKELNPKEHAAWTKLDFHQCENCPLSSDEYVNCPVAVDLEPMVASFSEIVSIERLQVEVQTASRTYRRECDAQSGVLALMGLIMSTSGCPRLNPLRVLAEMHLPFATLDETVFRICGAYLIHEYLQMSDGEAPDWEMTKLKQYFEELQVVNSAFKNRLNHAVERDSNLNAIGSLFFVTLGLQMSIDDKLQEFRRFFDGLKDGTDSSS